MTATANDVAPDQVPAPTTSIDLWAARLERTDRPEDWALQLATVAHRLMVNRHDLDDRIQSLTHELGHTPTHDQLTDLLQGVADA